jgi:hypothetical protein
VVAGISVQHRHIGIAIFLFGDNGAVDHVGYRDVSYFESNTRQPCKKFKNRVRPHSDLKNLMGFAPAAPK